MTLSASRQPHCQYALDEWDSTRYLETIVKLGEAYVLIISLYLHVKDDSWYVHRKDASDSLLKRALERVSQWGGPAIIAGDLNQAPQETVIWPTLHAKGWSEAHTFAREVLGTPTEPTYKEETKNDTAFFSPELAGSVTKISVHKGFLFPQHKPITITFKIPSIPLNVRVWKIPKPLPVEQLEIIKPDTMISSWM